MAEYCLECFNKTFKKCLTEKDVKLIPDICECCGKVKSTVVIVKKKSPRN
jgi:hypothetical protein